VKILQLHNLYQQPGGEDLVVADEARLLEGRGHEVVRHTVHNDQVNSLSSLSLGQRTIWSQPAYREVRAAIARHQPQLLHVHNTLPLLSPSVYYAASAEHIPVVQTLHNYRLTCPAALCFRNGVPCTECVGSFIPWRAIRHACYRDSRTASAAVATMLSVHRLLGTWDKPTVYIALTTFARDMFIDAGVPPDKLVVKPNFVDPDPGAGTGAGDYAVFVGRLSPEKGIETLLRAWRVVGAQLRSLIVGDGPLASTVAAATHDLPSVTWLGRRPPSQILSILQDAKVLVSPSESYETFGRTIVEAFATGTPVIAAGHGAGAELVANGVTGFHFRPGDALDLAAKVLHLNSYAPVLAEMRAAASKEFETRYTADINYRSLMAIYHRAIAA
jgi:glycosyltransferase involved in cell wall biosynthesis